MALTLDFSITQSTDCGTLTFTETTGDGTGGYGDGGNPVYTDVKNTILRIELPDTTVLNVHKDYLPTQAANPNGTQDYLPADVGYNKFPNGVWDTTFKVYTTDTASGAIVNGTEYIVTGAGGSITYDGTTYTQNQTFTGTSETTYTENVACEVNVFEASKQCNFLIYCGLRDCLKTLLLSRCKKPCDCRDDFHAAMNELVIDFNAAQLAFTAQNYKCANDTILRLEKQCSGICDDCDC